ncbi:2,4-diaminopentanoate dehydrogenase [Mycoplasma sp. P36-A1]|uniref:2,4-diaminopentanoate dehydrogenase n=1 Tax=Mycoplasma sp. P36-A1 TaxID=3252900 RepID=UPI003C2F5C21
MENVKVIIWGFGAMGSGMASMLLKKKGVEIVGVCDAHPDRVGKDFKSVINATSDHADVLISADIDSIVGKVDADVALIATDSFTAKAYDKIVKCLEAKLNVVSTAEEMAYPLANQPELAAKMDEIAKANGVSVLGTGINPGLIMDLLVLTLTGCMEEVDHITARRVNSLSPFGPAVMEEQGVGMPLDEFNEKNAKHELAGHVGFKESVNMIADGLGLKLENFEQQMKPIVTEVDRKSPYGFAAAGSLAGVNMTAQGTVDGKVMIDMQHPQQIEPQLGGVNTGDYIVLEGNPKVSMSITPEVDGGIGTIAMCVNMIPHTINATPGLKTMIDLPVPRAIMGDMRDLIK